MQTIIYVIVFIFMTEHSIAYRLATQIHASFFSPASNLTPDEIDQSGIRAESSGQNAVERLTARGEDGEIAYQNLSRIRRSGHFILTTVYHQEKTQITRITPGSPEEVIPILASTTFMQRLIELASARQPD